MKLNKGLQKFTKFQVKVNELLSLKKLNSEDLKILTEVEKEKFANLLDEKHKKLAGVERNLFFEKIENLLDDSVRNQKWENNHIQITGAISNLMAEYGRMPSTNEISKETCLSRQTIHKHLKE